MVSPAQLVEQVLALWQSRTLREDGQVSVSPGLPLQLLQPVEAHTSLHRQQTSLRLSYQRSLPPPKEDR